MRVSRPLSSRKTNCRGSAPRASRRATRHARQRRQAGPARRRAASFLRGRPSRRSVRLSVLGSKRRPPARSASLSAYCARVASFCSATRSHRTAGSVPPSMAWPPPPRRGARWPVRASLSQAFTVPTDTANRSANRRWLPSRRCRLQEGQPGTLAYRAHRRPYNNRLCEKRRQKALALIGGRHSDFGPTLAAEKLAECCRWTNLQPAPPVLARTHSSIVQGPHASFPSLALSGVPQPSQEEVVGQFEAAADIAIECGLHDPTVSPSRPPGHSCPFFL
jgi:hypothetical protein